jgi:hypothetical protein
MNSQRWDVLWLLHRTETRRIFSAILNRVNFNRSAIEALFDDAGNDIGTVSIKWLRLKKFGHGAIRMTFRVSGVNNTGLKSSLRAAGSWLSDGFPPAGGAISS